MLLDRLLSRWAGGLSQSDQRMGPDFLYIGCQKAGSRWLYDQLSAHPDFWMPPIKELHYFNGHESGAGMAHLAQRAERSSKPRNAGLLRRRSAVAGFMDQVATGDGGKLDLDWYASLFRWKGARLSGDITPDYATLSAGMIRMITSRFPELRYVLFVRDPVARAWSNACHAQRRGRGRVPGDWPEMQAFLETETVAARSYPSRILARWREHVPADRIFVGFFDQVAGQPDVLIAKVLSFLGADLSPPAIEPDFDLKRDHVRLPCPPEMRQRLAEWFADELEACARVFGGPATGWPARYGLPSAGPSA